MLRLYHDALPPSLGLYLLSLWLLWATCLAASRLGLRKWILLSLCSAIPLTIVTEIARLNCCNRIGKAPPFRWVLSSGEIALPVSLAAAWPAHVAMLLLKSSFSCPFGPATSGMIPPLKNLSWALSKGPLTPGRPMLGKS